MLGEKYFILGVTGACRTLEGEGVDCGFKVPRWFNAHFALALLAAYWLAKELKLDDETCAALSKQCDDLIETFPPLFEPLDLQNGPSDPTALDTLAPLLQEGAGRYLRSGHNVTYAAYLLKALREMPEFCTPEVIRRVYELIENCNGAVGREDAPIPSESDMPAYSSVADMIERLFELMISCSGNVGHVLTHAHALTELHELGYTDDVQKGLDAHRAHALLVRSQQKDAPLPDDRIIHNKDPLGADFWKGNVKTHRFWEVGHTFKYPYSFHRVKKYVSDPELVKKAEAKLWKII